MYRLARVIDKVWGEDSPEKIVIRGNVGGQNPGGRWVAASQCMSTRRLGIDVLDGR